MKRKLEEILDKYFDLLIVGGGIHGAWSAYDAALRGINVILLEKDDFGSGASSATLKLVHGGARYLQHMDFKRLWTSVRERYFLMQLAPHLFKTIPFLIPTYGHGLKGKELLHIGLSLYDIISKTKREIKEPNLIVPEHQVISKKECLNKVPILSAPDLNGAVVLYETQLHSPDRLTLSVIKAAHRAGAKVSNYTEVIDIEEKREHILVRIQDKISGEEFFVKVGLILLATGPWGPEFATKIGIKWYLPKVLSKGIQIVLPPFLTSHAIGVISRREDPEAIFSRGGIHYFLTPWRGYTLAGTTDDIYNGRVDDCKIREDEIERFIQELSCSSPELDINIDKVLYAFGGLRPVKRERNGEYVLERKDRVLDLGERFVGIFATKYTTARAVSAKAIDHVFKKIGKTPPVCKTHLRSLFKKKPLPNMQEERLSIDIKEHLVCHYGEEAGFVSEYILKDYKNRAKRLMECNRTLTGEIMWAAEHEMATRLIDVILRRTDIGTLGMPSMKIITQCADLMGNILRWNSDRKAMEIEIVKRYYENRSI